jgi:hypothetical protein
MNVDRFTLPTTFFASLAIASTIALLGGCGGEAPSRPAVADHAGPAGPIADRVVPRPDPAESSAELRRLVARGNQAFAAGRLFEPAGDSAIDHYAAAVAIDPNEPAVREAVSDLLPLALARAEAVIVRGSRADAAVLLDRIDRLTPGSPAIGALRGRLAAAIRADAEAEAAAAARLAEANPEPAPLTDAAVAEQPTTPPITVDAIALDVAPVRPIDLADSSRR